MTKTSLSNHPTDDIEKLLNELLEDARKWKAEARMLQTERDELLAVLQEIRRSNIMSAFNRACAAIPKIEE